MYLITLPFAVIFGCWVAWSLWSGKVSVGHSRWLGLWVDYEEFSREHDPLRFWIAIIALSAFTVFCIVLPFVAHLIPPLGSSRP